MVMVKSTTLIERVRTEHEEQRDLVSWFRKTYPNVLCFAIPNGGQRSATTAAKLKVEGVTKGIPDLFVPEWNLWIEMKRVKGGVLSKEQKEVIEYLKYCTHKVVIGLGFDDAKQKIEQLYNLFYKKP